MESPPTTSPAPQHPVPLDPAAVAAFKAAFVRNLNIERGVGLLAGTANDQYQALAITVRQALTERSLATLRTQFASRQKWVAYLSAEYLLGRQLGNNLLNEHLTEIARQALAELNLNLDALAELEIEPGLGNGGLGRLAACFMDSLATLQVPAVGYGLRYEYGIFRQTFVDGRQVERADQWLLLGSPWDFTHPEHAVTVGFGGATEASHDDQGRYRVRWRPARTVLGVPHNYMAPGYASEAVNLIRLWSARATHEFRLDIFNSGDYLDAVAQQVSSERITKVLYPDDSTPQGRQLRLEQQYFFVACTLADIFRSMRARLGAEFDPRRLPEFVAIQLNDTHPSIAVAELMRLLVDDMLLPWDRAWEITTQVIAYTNHTLLPEALETWPVTLFESLLPRHLEIIYEINARFLALVRQRFPGDEARVRRMSIIEEEPVRRVRMAYLAVVGSYRVNGVATLQSRLLRERVLRDFADLWPERFTSVTNGVTPRRFMRLANPGLSELISEAIGDGWLIDLEQLRRLEPLVDDAAFRARWRQVKAHNKQALAAHIRREHGPTADPAVLFDVMVKRLHEYKRQLLKALHVVTMYERLTANHTAAPTARLVYFGAKAAPGYQMAKRIIALINGIAEVVNSDPRIGDRLKVAFLPNFNVTLAERVYPAADLSEQISLAGKEASGTGNMKLALNGALTIGTLDGANIEIRERVGADNFFLFGLTEEAVTATRAAGYSPRHVYEQNDHLRRAIDLIAAGHFSRGDCDSVRPIVDSLLRDDPYLVLADYQAYVDCQDHVDRVFHDVETWTRMSIVNVARCGYFSSDRAIREYADRIWRVRPVPVPPP
ncbi:MAG: glycogen/starch/alpha-glucan phosphorylase [Chloroflexi bacterium]|nr:glycogen/starch/alpha-glucan phosphorylase [Chloroflexota bacterium]